MVKRTGLRQVPWQSWEHWLWVADEIFSGCHHRAAAAQNRIKAWQGRGNLPISVETTSALTSIQQRDPYFNHELPPGEALPDDMLQMMYAMAIQRLVNGVVDVSAKRNSSSVATRADFAGLPRLLVDIRHETAHNELPGLALLRQASKQALEWLKAHYWDPQRQALGNVRQELKKKLLEHCQLVIDILTPISEPDDEGTSEDVDGEGKLRLVKAMRAMRNLHRRTLKALKQKKTKLFQDLEDLCLSSTTTLVSVLVDDGLLEQGVLPGSEGRDTTRLESDYSDTDSFDLASATYTAWRYTICRLSNKLPRLPAMLLVAIVKRIGSSRPVTGRFIEFVRDTAGFKPTPMGTASSLKAPCLSSVPANSPKANEIGPLVSAGLDRLVAWCAWLLGNEDSEAGCHSISQEAVKSKTLGINRKLTAKADLNEELCRWLLRSCLYLSSERGPLVELVSLIALKVGNKKLQQQALTLAKFGSTVGRAFGPDDKSACVVLGPGASLKEVSTQVEPAGEGASTPYPDQPGKSGRTMQSDLDDSNYEMVKKQQQEFFARAVSEGNLRNKSCVRCEDGDEKDEPRTATEGQAKPQRQGSWTGGLRGRIWTVAENWTPCALGMIPSPYSVTGILPSLDLHETAEIDEYMLPRQGTGVESNSTQLQVDTGGYKVENRVTGNVTVNSVGTNVAKRKCGVEASSPTRETRAKKVGRHVHFSVACNETGKSSKSDVLKQMKASKIEGSRAEQLPGCSLLQGCVRQHGHFLHVSPMQLKSLKAAVHVL